MLQNILATAPERTQASFYRTAAGAEVDLVLRMPPGELWAIEIKRGLAPKIDRGFHHARQDRQPARSFLVYSGQERYPKSNDIEVIGLRELADELGRLG